MSDPHYLKLPSTRKPCGVDISFFGVRRLVAALLGIDFVDAGIIARHSRVVFAHVKLDNSKI